MFLVQARGFCSKKVDTGMDTDKPDNLHPCMEGGFAKFLQKEQHDPCGFYNLRHLFASLLRHGWDATAWHKAVDGCDHIQEEIRAFRTRFKNCCKTLSDTDVEESYCIDGICIAMALLGAFRVIGHQTIVGPRTEVDPHISIHDESPAQDEDWLYKNNCARAQKLVRDDLLNGEYEPHQLQEEVTRISDLMHKKYALVAEHIWAFAVEVPLPYEVKIVVRAAAISIVQILHHAISSRGDDHLSCPVTFIHVFAAAKRRGSPSWTELADLALSAVAAYTTMDVSLFATTCVRNRTIFTSSEGGPGSSNAPLQFFAALSYSYSVVEYVGHQILYTAPENLVSHVGRQILLNTLNNRAAQMCHFLSFGLPSYSENDLNTRHLRHLKIHDHPNAAWTFRDIFQMIVADTAALRYTTSPADHMHSFYDREYHFGNNRKSVRAAVTTLSTMLITAAMRVFVVASGFTGPKWRTYCDSFGVHHMHVLVKQREDGELTPVQDAYLKQFYLAVEQVLNVKKPNPGVADPDVYAQTGTDVCEVDRLLAPERPGHHQMQFPFPGDSNIFNEFCYTDTLCTAPELFIPSNVTPVFRVGEAPRGGSINPETSLPSHVTHQTHKPHG